MQVPCWNQVFQCMDLVVFSIYFYTQCPVCISILKSVVLASVTFLVNKVVKMLYCVIYALPLHCISKSAVFPLRIY